MRLILLALGMPFGAEPTAPSETSQDESTYPSPRTWPAFLGGVLEYGTQYGGREAEEEAALDALVMRPAQALLPVLGLEGGEELLGQIARGSSAGRLRPPRPLSPAVTCGRAGRRLGFGDVGG